MLTLFAVLFGQDPAPQAGNPLGMLIPMMLIFFLLWLFVLRPMKRQEADRQAKLLSNMKKGDRVLTIGGIYGTLISVAEKDDEVIIKVDDSTRLKMIKSAIARNITNEEAAKAPAPTQPEAPAAATSEAIKK